jgi:hypothetical protein
MTRLQDKALLCSISISRWRANKTDKKVSREVEKQHEAADGTGHYVKALVDKAHLLPLTQSESAIRKFHYNTTAPWDDEGGRILPSKSFEKFNKGIKALTDADERLVNHFVTLYPALRDAAPRRMGTMFNPKDFPDPREIADKFDVRVKMRAIPDADDFRVSVGNEAAAAIRAEIVAENDAKFQKAMQSCYVKLHDVVEHISTTLHKEDPRIFDTLVTNARDVVDCLVDLNLTDDPVLEQFRRDVEAMLPRKAAVFKGNAKLRKETADEADAILAKLKGYVL